MICYYNLHPRRVQGAGADSGRMKTTRITLLLASLAVVANLSAQITVTGYGVIRQYNVTQTSSSAPVASSGTPYALNAYVFGSNLTGTYNFSFAGGSETSPQALTIEGGGAKFESVGYLDATALNTAYGSGSFSMAINTAGGPQTPSLPSLPGGGFPELPQITNGSWISNQMQIDATINYTINFAAFSSFSSDDSYKLSIRDGSDVEVASGFWNTAGTTNFVVNATTLTIGQTYYASLQFNNNSIDYGVALAGANGNVGYSTINEFQILAVGAIPEPSTYAAIFGVLAFAGAAFRRRRQAA